MNSKSTFILSLILFLSQLSFAQEKLYTPTLHELDSILKTNCNLMKRINVNDIDMLMVNDCQLNEIEATLEYLKYVNIASQIDFKKREEIAIYEYFTETITQIAQLRVVLNQYMSNLDFWYYKKAMDFLAKNDSSSASEKFEKSLLLNPFYIPSLYQKAMFYLKNSQTNLAAKIAQFVAINLYPSDNDLLLIKAMNEQISKQFKNRGEKMLVDEYCNESLEIFMQADSFCSYYKSADCEYFKQGIIQSKFGLYRSYLRVANQAMDAHKYSIAESFVMKAKEYANINKSIFTPNDEANKLMKNIAAKYIDLGMYYKSNADYTQSNYYFDKAKSICSIFSDKEYETMLLKKEQEVVAVETTTIEPNKKIQSINNQLIVKNKLTKKSKKKKSHKKIKKVKIKTKTKKVGVKENNSNLIAKRNTKNRNYSIYCSLIEMGDEFSNAFKYEQALEKYQAAKEIEKTALTKENLVLDSLINATAFNIIRLQLETASFFIWANELGKADSAYQFGVLLQQKYHLENDQASIASLNSYRNKISQKMCQNTQDEIEQLNSKAINYITLKDFAKAQRLVDDANTLANNKNNCELTTLNTQKLSHFIKPITDYFNLKEIAKEAFSKSDYKMFTENHYNADKIYIKAKLDTIGIPNNNIIAYLNYQSNEQFILFAANYFIEFYDFENCLASLELLKNNGFEANKAKAIQIKLAQKQTVTDKAQQSDFDANKNIIKYTNNDKWFRFFNEEYKKK